MPGFIPLSIPNFEGNERKYVDDAIQQGWVSTGGAYIEKLEKNLAEYINTDITAACQSGTSGIHLALVNAGVGYNDLVIVPTLTFIAAVNPVKYVGADPIFMDCDDSLCMDSEKLEKFCENECLFENNKLMLKENRREIKALVLVHVFGNVGNIERIMDIAKKYNIQVIEDATEALGTKFVNGQYKGMYAGTIGDYGVFSFNGNKIITTGGGGAISCKSLDDAKHIKYLSTQAKDDGLFYIHNEIGYNYRMTNVQAAIGVAQLEELSEFINRKRNNYSAYKRLFEGYKLARILDFNKGVESNNWFYSLEVDISKIDCDIKKIIVELNSKGIQTRPIWGLIHKQKPYKDAYAYCIERALWYEERVINIPCSTNLTITEIEYVVLTIKELINKHCV